MEISPLQLQDSRPRSLSLGYGRSSDKLALFLAAWAEKIGGRTFDFVKLHWLGILNFLLGLFVGGALLAPVFRHLNMGGISKITYGLFGFFCHQKESRCFFLLGQPVAICARCFSFYASCLVLGLGMSLKKLKPMDLRLTILLLAPGMADVLLQILRTRESSNLLRATTGTLMGLAFFGYLVPRAQEGMRFLIQKDAKPLSKLHLLVNLSERSSETEARRG